MMPAPIRAALVLLAVALAGCAARVPPPAPSAPPPPAPALAWTAAIGRLDVDGAASCTAVLVQPTLILTAAHCLHQKESASRPEDLHFKPNFGAAIELPSALGQRVVAIGGDIREGHLARPEQLMKDWALVEISPAITGVAPLRVADLTTDEAVARLGHGDKLFTAGYGQGSMNQLKQHTACGIVDDPRIFAGYRNRLLVTNCIIRIGDSGGPVVLMVDGGTPNLLAMFAGFDTNRGLSYAVATGPIMQRLAPMLISGHPEDAVPLAFLVLRQAVICCERSSGGGIPHARD